MDTLPTELIHIIFNYIKLITDKRQFVKTCVLYNKITKKLMVEVENNLKPMYTSMVSMLVHKNLQSGYYNPNYLYEIITDYCVEKFTLELCNDKYFNLIPMSYLQTNNSIIMYILSSYGQTELLDIAYKNWGVNENMLEPALYNGHLDTVIWFYNHGCKNKDLIAKTACANGHKHILKWVIQNGYTFTNLSFFAVLGGRLNILIWLKKKDYMMVEDVNILEATLYGHLDIIIWVKENSRYKWTERTYQDVYNMAKRKNHLHIIEWLQNEKLKQ